MNSRIKVWTAVIMALVIQLTNSQTVTKVLQNGNNGYEGCKDSYTISEGPDVNYGYNSFLCHKNCQT